MDFRLCAIFVNLSLALFALPAKPGPVDEERAFLADREPLPGRLEMDPMRRCIFRTRDGESVPVAAIRRIDNPPHAKQFAGSSPAHRLLLWGEDSISGSIQSIEDDSVRLLIDAEQLLRVPLGLVARIEHSQGQALVFRDDFENPPLIGRARGAAERSESQAASGKFSLRLAEPDDAIDYALPTAVGAGWLEVQFFDPGVVAGGTEWLCELEFESRTGVKSLRVDLGFGSESYGLATPQGPAFPVQRIARRAGWNRLGIRFAPERTTVWIGDAVLSDRDAGLGSLRAVHLGVRKAPDAEPEAAPVPDAVAFIDDLQLRSSIAPGADHQPARDQDDVMLAHGDQLFGQVVAADAEQVEIQGAFGTHHVPWSQVHQIHLAQRELESKLLHGQRVLMRFSSNALPSLGGIDSDRLEGVIQDVTAEAIHVEHPHIGAIRLPRARVRELEFFAHGRWLALDSRFHHFGDAVDARFQQPFPSGPDRSWEFAVDAVPSAASLILTVVGLEAMAAAGDGAKRLENDEWRTYVTLNGQQIDPMGLNHRVPPRWRGPLRLSLPISPELFRAGRNTLRIYQTPEKDNPNSYNDCGVYGIGIEFSEK